MNQIEDRRAFGDLTHLEIMALTRAVHRIAVVVAYGATALGFALAGVALDDLLSLMPVIRPLVWAGALLTGAYVVSRGVAKGLKR